jgi:hypothetical protein
MSMSALPKLFGCLLLGLLLGGCSSRHVDREQLLAGIQARSQLPDSHYDLLWYQGSMRGRHYFKHIRGYFLDERIFIVDADQLPIARPIGYTLDSRQWQQVERIGSRWHSARKQGELGWQADPCLAEARVCLRLE